jgi:hypothetical protein
MDDTIDHLNLKTPYVPGGAWIFFAGSRFDIKLPSVPGAFDEIPFYRALAQWSSGMRTYISKSIDSAIEVKEGNTLVLEFKTLAGAGREIRNLGNRVKLHFHLVREKTFNISTSSLRNNSLMASLDYKDCSVI